MTAIAFSCTCGTVSGQIDVPAPRIGNHLVCHCPDCRTAPIHLGQPDPGQDGVDLWQTTPDRITLTRGAERLAVLRLSPKGLHRWYAGCCGTPLFNTLKHPRLAFAGVSVAALDDPAPLGPLVGRAFIKGTDGKYRHQGFNRIGLRILRNMIAANLSGRWRKTPFFDAAGQLTAPVTVLSKDERRAATPAR